MTEPPPRGVEIETELTTSIDDILAALRAVGNGDLSQRLETNYPETHPVGALAASINSMVAMMAEEQARTFAYVEELNERIETIERQRQAIRSLSVPIIEVWAGVLCAPIVGVVDTLRASEVTSTLLGAVAEKKARFVIIDVTGVDVLDTRSADHFLRIARAVMLLGATCFLSGIHPNVARTIVQMGVELKGLTSFRSMRDALRRCVLETRGRGQRGDGATRRSGGREKSQ